MTILRCVRACVILPLAVATPVAAAQSIPQSYVAEYSAAYKGRDAGTSVFSIRTTGDPSRMVYASETQVKGLLRIAAPNPVIDRSTFDVASGRIVPLTFEHQDGSRRGQDNHTITFDWSADRAKIAGEHGVVEIEIVPGMLDRGTLQVALMRDLARGVEPEAYTVVDEDSAKTYRYAREGTRAVDTGIGRVDTVTYTQSREGSSRHTRIDFAPSLGYIPVRIEQIRDGEPQSLFVLQSLER